MPRAEWSPNDERWMRRALELAARAQGNTHPNPCVGCVIVSADGGVLGEGWHHAAGQPHAEVEALNDAAGRGHGVRGATCYVTLEPCNHQGRTGPCSEALIAAGISRVVIATMDPHRKAQGGAERLRAAGILVESGLLARESALLNPAFMTSHLLGRPLVTLKWAMTLDGCTAVPSGDSRWITGDVARAEVHRRRAQHGAVLAGIGTVLADDARLSARPIGGAPFPVMRVVLDSNLRLPPGSPFLQHVDKQQALVMCSSGAPADREAALIGTGALVARLNGPITPERVLSDLHRRGVQSVYVEGGRRVAGSFLAAGLVDRVESWIAPKLAGGGSMALGPTSLQSPLARMGEALPLHTTSLSTWGNDFLVEGWLSRHLFETGR
ncbi:bifunctional diaminohydroxyphosphoribosylaminopyrimidine deaminase/5-amino-6-(5-phosphoribosylamino)uracil reductase RibD [bacterium]|nr:bifunctional diaminohydroxyphosphoribosylaminopyrimidine deaminase/5-amino-6-(5-phosphoribosylamino)uracil reductase RibD [bacterium]